MKYVIVIMIALLSFYVLISNQNVVHACPTTIDPVLGCIGDPNPTPSPSTCTQGHSTHCNH